MVAHTNGALFDLRKGMVHLVCQPTAHVVCSAYV